MVKKLILIIVLIFSFHSIVKANESVEIQIDVVQRILSLIDTKKNEILKQYYVGLGMNSFKTPIGKFLVIEKSKNPGWINPYNKAETIKPGENSPLGTRWITFHKDSATNIEFGIHGTYNYPSVGKYSSHGCVRMYIEDIEELFDLIEIDTPVLVFYERLKIDLLEDNNIALAIYKDPYNLEPLTLSKVKEKILKKYPLAIINEDAIKVMLSIKTKEYRLVGYIEN